MGGQAQATSATPQAAGAGCSGADGALRQTKPMASEAAKAVTSKVGTGGAKRSQLAGARLAGSSSLEQKKRGFAVDERDRGGDSVSRTVRRGKPVRVRRF